MTLKVAFSESAMCLSNLQKHIFQITILKLKFEFPAHYSKQLTVFPHIVSPLEYFPHWGEETIQVFLRKGKINEETIWNFQGLKIPKKNSCRGNYMRKYGMYIYLKLKKFIQIILRLFFIIAIYHQGTFRLGTCIPYFLI